jgi:hypothetical protein
MWQVEANFGQEAFLFKPSDMRRVSSDPAYLEKLRKENEEKNQKILQEAKVTSLLL